MRIALGGIATECCTFSPILTQLEDFRIREGDDLLNPQDYPFLANTRATLFPTLQARAIPGGKIAKEAYRHLKQRFLEHLQDTLPLDGLYLDMHGAMHVEGLDDAEGDWYQAARAVVGQDCLMSASYDLHGNLSQRIMDNLDMLTAFRTAPHIDYLETRAKAFAMLEHCLTQNFRPYKVWIPVPVLLPGERTSTEYEPTASLYQALNDVDKVEGILDASILVGYVWADEPRSTASIVLTGTHLENLKAHAKTLALGYWNTRHDFNFSVPYGSMDDALDWAAQQHEACLIISDSGDNPTAGGVGDRVDFLRRLLERNIPDAILGGLADPPAVETCYQAGAGERVRLNLGGQFDPSTKPLKLNGTVKHLSDAEGRERQAVVQVDGISIVLSAKRRPYHLEKDFLELGLDPKVHKMTIVKVGYLVPDLKRIAKGIFLTLSPGVVDQFVERLPYTRIQRPTFPFDQHFQWHPEETL